MGVTLFPLFALLAAATTVSSLKDAMVLPVKAMSLHEQCSAKPGFKSECWNINRNGDYPHCGPVACAASTSRGDKYQAYFFENAPDGLKCGERKVCYQGRCQNLRPGVPMPRQTPTDFLNFCECYVVGGRESRRPQRN